MWDRMGSALKLQSPLSLLGIRIVEFQQLYIHPKCLCHLQGQKVCELLRDEELRLIREEEKVRNERSALIKHLATIIGGKACVISMIMVILLHYLLSVSFDLFISASALSHHTYIH